MAPVRITSTTTRPSCGCWWRRRWSSACCSGPTWCSGPRLGERVPPAVRRLAVAGGGGDRRRPGRLSRPGGAARRADRRRHRAGGRLRGGGLLGEYFVAAEVVFIALVGECLEAFTFERAQRAIQKLLEYRPRTARVLRDGQEVEIAADAAAVGDVLVVRPGERIAADGAVVRGRSAVDQAVLTGESLPVDKGEGTRSTPARSTSSAGSRSAPRRSAPRRPWAR